MPKFTVPTVIKEFSRFFQNAGWECYLVGGAVRNMAAGIPVKDYDFATNAKPEDVIKLFRKVIPTGIKHGTVTVLFKKEAFEVTTFRVEGKYTNQRHPDNISFTGDLYEDLKRRDFTINAMAIDLSTGKLIDPHNGLTDLKDRTIRAIGNPVERFNEDGLRIMRACRFASQLHFEIEPATLSGLEECSKNIKMVSAERIKDELIKILITVKPSIGLEYLRECGTLEHILPELTRCMNIEQKGNHRFNVYYHSLTACDGAPADSLTIRIAALFHDIGKADTLAFDKDGFPTFHNHERVSGKLTQKILTRLKFPKAVEKQVKHLVEQHMFHYQEEWTDSAVRRFMVRTGLENIDDLIMLRLADKYGMDGKQPYDLKDLQSLKKRIAQLLKDESAFSIKDLEINGDTLNTKADIPKGPAMGKILNLLFEAVLDDPQQNNEETLIMLAKNLYKIHFEPHL